MTDTEEHWVLMRHELPRKGRAKQRSGWSRWVTLSRGVISAPVGRPRTSEVATLDEEDSYVANDELLSLIGIDKRSLEE